MKIIHTADIHLGNPRTDDILAQLEKIINIIQKEKAEVLLIAGDLFNKEMSSTSKIRENVRRLFFQIPQTQIFILPGNHDSDLPYRDEFYYGSNVYVAKKRPFEIKKINNIDIYFFPFTEEGSSQRMIEIIKSNPSQAKFRIGVVHGTYMDDKEIRDHLLFQNEGYYPIFSSDLKEMNLDYLALGHFHYHRLWRVENTWCGYPGTIEILSFKEPEDRKIIMIEVNEELTPYSVNIGAQKKIGEVKIDINKIEELRNIRKYYDILRVTVEGIVKNEKETTKKLEKLRKELDIKEIINQTKSFANFEETKIGQMIKDKIQKRIETEPEKEDYWKSVLISGFEFWEDRRRKK
jgi:DNA repair exonuclease SbcCD nuclease subunit